MSTYLIDGHNVLGVLGRSGTNVDIEFLIRKIRTRFQSKGGYVVLIFDNGANHAGYSRPEIPGKFVVYFADPSKDDSGDDRMVRFLKEYPGYAPGCICVTNDRELKDRLHVLKADKKNMMFSEDFLSFLERRDSTKEDKVSPRIVLSSAESAEKNSLLNGIDTDKFNEGLLEAFTKKRAER